MCVCVCVCMCHNVDTVEPPLSGHRVYRSIFLERHLDRLIIDIKGVLVSISVCLSVSVSAPSLSVYIYLKDLKDFFFRKKLFV